MELQPILRFNDRLKEGIEPLSVRFCWPSPVFDTFLEGIFFGIFHPKRELRIRWNKLPTDPSPFIVEGSNWSIVSTTSAVRNSAALIHHGTQTDLVVAFRGYIVNANLHSFSSSESIVSYWSQGLGRRHNGVFSTAILDNGGQSLTLITDPFGFGPLYYRTCAGAILFSINPRFLSVAGDEPDYLAWRTLIQSGFISSDRTLSKDVHRVPSGKLVRFSRNGLVINPWFNFDEIPDGVRLVNDQTIEEVELCFQQAVSRCLALDNNDNVILPLSSGHDSRRILTALISQNVKFESFTVRVRQKNYRDLDAPIAAAMASDFGFMHKIIEQSQGMDYISDDVARRTLVDSETQMHTWAIRMMKSLPKCGSLFFDGILGDVLGNPGFRMASLYLSVERDLNLIIQECFTNAFDSILKSSIWPSSEDVMDEIRSYLQSFMHRKNMAEFAFILLRQRRSTALWSQQLLPIDHILVCPYLDLDYISLLLNFKPTEKHRTVLQRQCLSKYWPEFYKYPGNRDIPLNMPEGNPRLGMKREWACYRQLLLEIQRNNADYMVYDLLTLKGRIAFLLSNIRTLNPVQGQWFLHPLLELICRQINNVGCWTLGQDLELCY